MAIPRWDRQGTCVEGPTHCSGPQGYQEARLALCQEQGRLEGEGEEVSHLTLHTDVDPLANALEPVAALLCTPTQPRNRSSS